MNHTAPSPGPRLDDAIDELNERLSRYPAHRYPVQHATAQFHLGRLFLDAGLATEAAGALRCSVSLFEGLVIEQAKARNMLGAALRLEGRLGEAIAAFRQAATGFEEVDQPLEEAAATFNCGLAQREAGASLDARHSFEQARRQFERHGAAAQAATAGRELGASLLATGEPDSAVEVLEGVVTRSTGAADYAGGGAAGNVLGLAYLAAGRVPEAVEALGHAVAAHPRSVRPADYAMTKANLALAHEAAGDAPRARLAALQAHGTPGAAEPVRAQASALMVRLGRPGDDLFVVLEDEPRQRWPAVVREEVLRWADSDRVAHESSAANWIQGLVSRRGREPDLAEAWLAVLLELPPPAMEDAVRAVVVALGDLDFEHGEQFRRYTSRAMARFNGPQWMRLKDTFSRISDELRQPGSWG